MHIDTLTFRASLHNVGLGKKARYFLIQTLIADCDTRLVCLKLFWKSHPRVVEATIEGQSTFGMERTKGGKVEKLQIVEGASTLRWKLIYFNRLNNVYNCKNFCYFHHSIPRSLLEARELKGLRSEISLLHINCEGCEWEMLENLIEQPDVMSNVWLN